MKKIALALTVIFMIGAVNNVSAQKAKKKVVKKATNTAAVTVAPTPTVTPVAPAQPASDVNQVKTLPAAVAPVNDIDKYAKFDKLENNFGNLPEGPQATTTFVVTNIGKEPLTLSNVQASCGCTVPEWSKEAIAPGQTGTIKAIYNTQGRVGPFTKTLTVTTNQGTKQLTLKGVVDAAPTGSTPASEGSMIKH